jgi:hypothetical protein
MGRRVGPGMVGAGELQLGTKVDGFRLNGGEAVLETSKDNLVARCVINCAGSRRASSNVNRDCGLYSRLQEVGGTDCSSRRSASICRNPGIGIAGWVAQEPARWPAF